VEKRNGSVDLDSDDDALDGNNPEVISLEEVCFSSFLSDNTSPPHTLH